MIRPSIVLIRFFKTLWSGFRKHEFPILFFSVIAILLAGTIFYHNVEGWSYFDALYFCVTTLTTIGFGDFTPTSNPSKIFTIIYIFAGIGIILGFVDAVAHHARKQNPFHVFNILKIRLRKRKR